MDRYISGSSGSKDPLRLSRSDREPFTPYERMLHSVTVQGTFTPPVRRWTRCNRILEVCEGVVPGRKLAHRLIESAREETMLSLTDWMLTRTEVLLEPASIETYKILEAPNLEDDYYLNLLDWSGFTNQLAVGLQGGVHVWDAVTEESTELARLPREDTVASLAWKPDSPQLAVGSKYGRVEILDAASGKFISNLSGHCKYRTGVLSWNPKSQILSSGARDKLITHHDCRMREPIATSRGHIQEVCGLKWDPKGGCFASGGNDNKVMIWDERNLSTPMIVYDKHVAAVKALAWSPHVTGLLASGGGTADRTIRFWNIRNASSDPIKEISVNSQVCNMLWSPHSNEIVTTHGFSDHQVLRWSYPSLTHTATMLGHQQRVLHLCMSPDGQSVVTGSPDQTLRFWRVFEAGKKVSNLANRPPVNPFLL